jgi:DegV family protein with EDD domain
MKTAIITDSNSGISEQEAGRLGIYVVPMPVIINNTILFENKNILAEQFFDSIKRGDRVTTSQPSLADIMQMWENLLDEYEELVYIPMSSGLSSSCMTAKGIANEYDGRVYVADNHRISVTLKQSVLYAKRLADKDVRGSEIVSALEREAYDSSIYLAVDSLEHLQRGGRINPAARMIGAALSIKPILAIYGNRLEPYANVRGGYIKCLARMTAALKEFVNKSMDHQSEKTFYIGLAGAGIEDSVRDKCMQIIQYEFPGAVTYYDPLPLSICAHTGPGAIGIGMSVGE